MSQDLQQHLNPLQGMALSCRSLQPFAQLSVLISTLPLRQAAANGSVRQGPGGDSCCRSPTFMTS